MAEWADSEDRLLGEEWKDRSAAEIAHLLLIRLGKARTPRAVTVRASRLGLSRGVEVDPETEDLIVALINERRRLRSELQQLTDDAIAEKMELPVSAVVLVRRTMQEETA